MPTPFPSTPTPRRRPALRALALALLAAWGITLLARRGAADETATTTTVTPRSATPPPPPPPHHPPGRTRVVLYGEALCPDTAAWVARVLAPAVEAGLIGPPGLRRAGSSGGGGGSDEEEEDDGGEVEADAAAATATAAPHRRRRPPATFRYVGWGNATPAKVGAGPSPTCQHGPAECRLDAALNCAAALVAPRAASFDLTLCYFKAVAAAGAGAAVTAGPALMAGCAAAAGVRDWDRVLACAAGERGAALAEKAGAETAGLDPKKTFVPWVVVDGEALAGECGALVARVCERVGRGGPGCEGPPPNPTPACPGAPRVGGGGVGGVGGVVRAA